MRKQRKIKKEDIGDPSNFVHVQHVGFGQKKSSLASLHVQRSLDLGGESEREVDSESSSPAIVGDQGPFPLVERRTRGSRTSLIPRHHRSTTTCIFPDNGHNFQHHLSIQSRSSRSSSNRDTLSPDKNGLPLKPTFGSLLNLSFLPLGMGKSSSKSPSVNKTKRMSLLNLTAANLFAGQKGQPDEGKEKVMMTGYTRRRSFSKDDDESRSGTLKKQSRDRKEKDETGSSSSSTKENGAVTETPIAPTSSRIPLAKLGRSKSSMSEFSKRPKLRLKIVPPVAPPPPVPIIPTIKTAVEDENLPSPPSTPLPSPPKTPTSAPPMPPPPLTLEEEELAVVVMRRIPKSPPRSRIIPLPSTPSIEALDPVSPQYLTPTGGSSPAPAPVGESSFPLLSPTIPPTSTPFYAASQRSSGTPPVWPLQPTWPTPLSFAMQQKEPIILEIPSPLKEEMDIVESEYDPVASIVDSFIFDGPGTPVETLAGSPTPERCGVCGTGNITACPNNLKLISSALQENVPSSELPNVIAKLFKSTQELLLGKTDKSSDQTSRIYKLHGEILTKTLKLWAEVTDGHAGVEELAKIIDEENQQAAECLKNIRLSDNTL